MFFEQGLKIFSIIILGIYIARYLGPNQFGILSYAIAISTIFMAISRLGMESILVRALVDKVEQRGVYMGTAFRLMLVSAVISFALMGAGLYFFESNKDLVLYTLIISTGLFFQSFMVIDYNFQSQVNSKYSAISKSIALLLGALAKLILVYLNADILWIVIAFSSDYILAAIFLVVMHAVRKQELFLFKYNSKVAKEFVRSAWPLMLSALTIILYMRVDQIMIKSMLGIEQLGIYSAVARVYEGWLMFAVILSTSLLPAIIKSKNQSKDIYEKRLAYLFSFVFWSSIFVSILITIIGHDFINLMFGSAYLEGSHVFIIMMWSSSFAALGSVTARYLVAENMERKVAVRTFVALIINVILNYTLMPIYGIEGAAISTLVCLVVANYIIDYFDKDLVQLLRIKNNALRLNYRVKND